MKNPEHEERFLPQMEIGDRGDTYEDKNMGDQGSQTVFNGTHNIVKVVVQKKVKKKQPETEKVVFTE